MVKVLSQLLRYPILKTQHNTGYCWQFNKMWVVRKGNWKLIDNPHDTSNKQFKFNTNRWLVNLENDPGEQTNLASKYPNMVTQLEKQYQKCLQNSFEKKN